MYKIAKKIKPFVFKMINTYLQKSDYTILDVGAGNHSASLFKTLSPECHYYGIDLDRNYNNNQYDFECMSDFYEMDLTELNFEAIPDDFFDVIRFSHVIEHLHNGELVVEALLPKLKRGGVTYIEYPSVRSIKFPSCKGTLNFYDDTTHIKLYPIHEILNILTRNNMKILKCGVKRDWKRIILMPMFAFIDLIRKKHISAGVFWDIFGFAEFVVARKQGECNIC